MKTKCDTTKRKNERRASERKREEKRSELKILCVKSTSSSNNNSSRSNQIIAVVWQRGKMWQQRTNQEQLMCIYSHVDRRSERDKASVWCADERCTACVCVLCTVCACVCMLLQKKIAHTFRTLTLGASLSLVRSHTTRTHARPSNTCGIN